MEKNFEELVSSPLFHGVSPKEAMTMLCCLSAHQVEFEKHEMLLRAGEKNDSVGLLVRGSALVIQEDFWGNRNIVSRVGPGELFGGEFACARGAVPNVSVEAEKPGLVLYLEISRVVTTCHSACVFHSRVIRNLMEDLARKNMFLNEKLSHMGQRATRDKLLSYLSSEALRAGSDEFSIPFNRQELADFLSVDRSAMSKELGRLRDDGLLEFDRNHFRLLPSPGGGV